MITRIITPETTLFDITSRHMDEQFQRVAERSDARLLDELSAGMVVEQGIAFAALRSETSLTLLNFNPYATETVMEWPSKDLADTDIAVPAVARFTRASSYFIDLRKSHKLWRNLSGIGAYERIVTLPTEHPPHIRHEIGYDGAIVGERFIPASLHSAISAANLYKSKKHLQQPSVLDRPERNTFEVGKVLAIAAVGKMNV